MSGYDIKRLTQKWEGLRKAKTVYEAYFMGVVLCCLEATDHGAEYVQAVHQQFERIAAARADLVERYWNAHARRDAGEVGRLLSVCAKIIREGKTMPAIGSGPEGARFEVTVCGIGNLRINAATGRFHVGYSPGVPLFSGPGAAQH